MDSPSGVGRINRAFRSSTMDNDELIEWIRVTQNMLNDITNAHLDAMAGMMHAPHIGMTCAEYERMLAEAGSVTSQKP